MSAILMLHGPNLNLLGTRQTKIYGTITQDEIFQMARKKAEEYAIELDCRQSNYEGQLIDWIQDAQGKFDGIIINAGAYTHTSIALMDALSSVDIPTLELHLSDINEREEFRKHSYISKVAFTMICGQGADGYPTAIETMVKYLDSRRS